MRLDQTLESLLIEASVKSGKHLRDHAFDPGNIKWKKEDDPVTDRDIEAERIIIDTLCIPLNMKVIGEESGYNTTKKESCKLTAIIDPLDGTKSYLRREFNTAVSIAIEEENQLIAGSVYDFMRDILYVGFKGNTYLVHNGKIEPFKQLITKEKIGIITTADPQKISKEDRMKLQKLRKDPKIHLTGRNGSIALALAHTALGIYDSTIFFHEKIGNVWDIAAGVYLLQCTKHQISDSYENPFDIYNTNNGIMALGPRYLEHLFH